MTRITTYYCKDFRPIKLGELAYVYGNSPSAVRSVDDAAKAFGLRLARRRYGTLGYCRQIGDGHHANKKFHYDIWIEKPDGTGMKHRNVRLSITYEIKLN